MSTYFAVILLLPLKFWKEDSQKLQKKTNIVIFL